MKALSARILLVGVGGGIGGSLLIAGFLYAWPFFDRTGLDPADTAASAGTAAIVAPIMGAITGIACALGALFARLLFKGCKSRWVEAAAIVVGSTVGGALSFFGLVQTGLPILVVGGFVGLLAGIAFWGVAVNFYRKHPEMRGTPLKLYEDEPLEG